MVARATRSTSVGPVLLHHLLHVIAVTFAVLSTFVVAPLGDAYGADTAASAAIAQKLFDEGMTLMDQGRFSDACPKLARSHELAPSGGTLLNLGDCYEKNGQTASAWVSFRDAAARAGLAGMKQAQGAALLRADRLLPKLVYMKITLAPSSIPGIEIKRDGVVVSRPELGMDVPIDPGPHRIEASAKGYDTWQEDVRLATGDAPRAVNVPVLVKSAASPAPPQGRGGPASESTDAGATQRRLGLILGGGGLIALGVGGVFGLKAFSTNDEALTHCVDGKRCDEMGLTLTDTASTQATVSTVLFVGGTAVLAAGVVLFFTAGGSRSQVTAAAAVKMLRSQQITF